MGAPPAPRRMAYDFAEGGEVDGPGTGTSDSIPATLEEGSYVVNAETVRRKGENYFRKMVERNETEPMEQPGSNPPAPGRPQHFSRGGGNMQLFNSAMGMAGEAQAGMGAAAQGQQGVEDLRRGKKRDAFGDALRMAATVAQVVALFNEGGEVGATAAQVPARISNGEFVLPPQTVRGEGLDALDKLNFEQAPATGARPGMGLPQALPI